MVKKFIKKLQPHPDKLKNIKSTRLLGKHFFNPQLWKLNRRSAATAFFIGIFYAFIPVPFQMLLAGSTAILFRSNLPLSISLVWITNPITMPIIFYFTYKIGCFILGEPVHAEHITLSLEWLQSELSQIWLPLYLGSIVTGFVCAVLSYFAILLIWRWQIIKAWRSRRAAIRQIQPKKKA